MTRPAPATQSSIRGLVDCYERMQETPKAEPLLRELAEFRKENDRADPAAYAGQFTSLGLNPLQQGRAADAEPLLRQCLVIRRKKQPDDRATSTVSRPDQRGIDPSWSTVLLPARPLGSASRRSP
jgi:hypothetical protein